MAIAVVPRPEVDLIDAQIWNPTASHPEPSDISVLHEGIEPNDLALLSGGIDDDVRCSLDLSLTSRERRQYLSSLSAVGGLTNVTAIDAPVAAFAHCWSQRPLDMPLQPLWVVAVAGRGQCSVMIADTNTRRLVAVSLTEGTSEIRDLVSRAAPRSTAGVTVESETAWSEVQSQIRAATTFGLSPLQRDHFDSLLGDAVEHIDNARHALLDGLSRLVVLSSWTANWPTTRVHLGTGWTRQPGPLRATVEEHLARLRSGATLHFSDPSGRPLGVRAGSVLAEGCVIPPRLGTQPRLRLIDDGRILMLGPAGTRPLAADFRWPIPASGRNHVEIRSASSVGVEMASPTVAPVPSRTVTDA